MGTLGQPPPFVILSNSRTAVDDNLPPCNLTVRQKHRPIGGPTRGCSLCPTQATTRSSRAERSLMAPAPPAALPISPFATERSSPSARSTATQRSLPMQPDAWSCLAWSMSTLITTRSFFGIQARRHRRTMASPRSSPATAASPSLPFALLPLKPSTCRK